LFFPITLFSAAATMMASFMAGSLHGHGCLNRGIALVIPQLKIFKTKIKNASDPRIQLHYRKRIWCAGKLEGSLLAVIIVKMHVSKTMHKLTRFHSANLCDHHR